MKKIFMASICAIMAVTAANADIASTTYVGNAIGALDNNNSGTLGKYVFTVDTQDGIAVPELKEFDGKVTDGSDSSNAPTTAAVAAYVKEKTDVISEGIGTANEEITSLKNRAGALEDEVDAINNADTGILAQAKADATSKANAAQSAAEGKVTELANGAVKTNTEAIAAINNSDVMKSGVDSTVVGKANTALQKADITTGTGNGTISVDGADVAVKGLGSAAYTASTAYATFAQGQKADSAVQSVVSGTTNGTISVDGTDVAVKGLGSAAYTASTEYATSDQGTKADAALPAATLANAAMQNDGLYTLTMKKEGTTITYYWEKIGR